MSHLWQIHNDIVCSMSNLWLSLIGATTHRDLEQSFGFLSNSPGPAVTHSPGAQ